MLSDTIREIASLQPQYSSENTEPMQRKGRLIRQTLPSQLAEYHERFSARLGTFGGSTDFEGRDGSIPARQQPMQERVAKAIS